MRTLADHCNLRPQNCQIVIISPLSQYDSIVCQNVVSDEGLNDDSQRSTNIPVS